MSCSAREAGEILRGVDACRERARRATRWSWFPMIFFGTAMIGAVALSRGPVAASGQAVGWSLGSAVGNAFAGGRVVDSGVLSWYWLVAIPGGYLATVWYWRRRLLRLGTVRPLLRYGLAGIAAYSVVVLTLLMGAWGHRLWPLAIWQRGLVPLLVIGVPLVVAAVEDRSRAMGLFTVVFSAMCIVANLYDLENIVSPWGIHLRPAAAGLIPGSVLVGGGLLFRLGEPVLSGLGQLSMRLEHRVAWVVRHGAPVR